jgi:hypothetical protein
VVTAEKEFRRAKGEEILGKIQRAWKVALGENKTVTII